MKWLLEIYYNIKYDIFELKNCFYDSRNVLSFNERIVYGLEHLWRCLIRPINNLYCLIHRAFDGWCYKDTWNLDYYLSDVIIKTVSHLRKNQAGYPGHLTQKKWHKILDDIIKGFTIAKKIGDGYFEVTKREQKAMEKGMKLFIDNFSSLWD